MIIDQETHRKIIGIGKRLEILVFQKRINKNYDHKTNSIAINKLLEDLPFVIGKLSSIYETILSAINDIEKD
jgi:hypothetical protein